MAYIARLTFYADIGQVEALRELAHANGTTISGYVRGLVVADVRKHGKERRTVPRPGTPQAITQARGGDQLLGQRAFAGSEPDGGGADA